MLTVALYGNSLVLASIGARIERRTRLQPVTIDAAQPGALEKLSEFQPDVVLLDLGTTQPDPVVALWKTRPELVLIGVDLGADRMLILSGQPARALTAEDLIETLTTHEKGQSSCTTF
jgi:CheY-like chemotaxis protein